MANAAGDAHEYPVYGYHFRLVFPILDADGDLVTGAAGLDSERSIDQGTFADCTNEATEIATSSGMYYLDVTGAETTCKACAVIVKTSTTGAKTTPMVLYPRRLPQLETGTAQAGAAGTITLASGASAKDDFYNGLFVGITNDTPSGAQYQLRRIIDYVGSTKVATIESNWGTNPSSSSTYEILIPEGFDSKAWAGTKVADPTTSGIPDVNVLSIAANAITAAAIAANAIGSSELASGAITTATFAAGAIDAAALAANCITSSELANSAIDAILNRAITEGYAADGAAPSIAQALSLLIALLSEFSISGTTLTAKKLDGSTTAATFTLNDGTSPTSITRAS